ncbi:hypothetical protein KVR01_005802 [Diaporthe batatas]|uniref:uncharacterized protein n=1 Tax=Diaporthe batatas TaxID=748121 RepID=UPI001D039B72|nr:uncharacterized protein KVR01_005802 [Diaporthe batatas]KAG8163884.1 hypothetical protein KVR01_005802 [Diaporthe batatas]
MKGIQTVQASREDRRRSFGIGGAGNIRTRAEAVVHDVLPSERLDQRRRSSVLSKVSSSTSGSGSWKDVKEFFRNQVK